VQPFFQKIRLRQKFIVSIFTVNTKPSLHTTILFMPLVKYIARYTDSLIRKKATGTLNQLAKKLALSERTTLEYLKVMKKIRLRHKVQPYTESYYYIDQGEVVISFKRKY